MTNPHNPASGGTIAGLCIGAAVVAGAPLLGWYAVYGYYWGELGVAVVGVVGILLLAGGWVSAFAILRRWRSPRPQLVAWLCLGTTVLVAAATTLIIGLVAGLIGLLTIAFLWTGDYVAPLTTISAIAVAVLTLPVAVASGIIYATAFANRPARVRPSPAEPSPIRV
ncbi:hypothetical protein [Herbiconiux solani]|uniref:hypothetical protein n=1 Tax=Herbiconiux solani TaxID=661329 RepID=UPI0008263D8D|nr:hypothetical protein [Herbiconiux solani]